MIEAWGARTLETALTAGIIGGVVLGCAVLLRHRAGSRSGILLLGLAQFLVPGIVSVPVLLPVPGLEAAVPVVSGGPSAFFVALALAQGAGLAVGLILLARSAATLCRVRRGARPAPPGAITDLVRVLAETHGIRPPPIYLTRKAGPAAVGVRRPAILLPETLVRRLDLDALRLVLAHEVAHLARLDPLAALLRRIVLSAWWFHPVAWGLARMHRAAAEDACDDAALRHGDPETFCEVVLASARISPMVAGGAELSAHPLERRLRRLLHGGRRSTFDRTPPRRLVRGRLLAALACSLCLAAPVRFVTVVPPADAGLDEPIVIRQVIVAEEPRR